MSIFTTAELLTYKPTEALLILINESLGTSLNPRYVEIGDIVASDGLQATVEIKALVNEANEEPVRFTGQGTIDFTRLDIGQFFDGQYSLTYDVAITSYDVARMITDNTGILFDERDFVNSVITSDSNKLTASPNSLRWVGELSIVTE